MKSLPVIVLLCAGSFTGCSSTRPQPNQLSVSATPSPEVASDVDASVEFTLNLSNAEKKSRIERIKQMPEYAKVDRVASELGFHLGNFEREQVGESSLTGLSFMGDAKQFIGDHEFRFLVMGPAKDRVDTIRVQAWGVQTKQARQRLEAWATKALSSLKLGQLPREFVRQLYAGANVGDDGISNGFCSVQVVQRPINPGIPSSADRITIDLIFDKTD